MFVVARLMTLCVLVHAGQDTESVRSLTIGQPIEAELVRSTRASDDPAATASFRVEVHQGRAVTIELRSYTFDAYLILCDGAGVVLAKDDHGLARSQARIVIMARP